MTSENAQPMEVKSSATDSRYTELDSWCSTQLSKVLGNPTNRDLQSVSGDASFRRYYRAHTENNTSFIAVDAPPQTENCQSFVAIAHSWRQQGLRTPTVHSVDMGRGYMLLEDFGDTLLYSTLDNSRKSTRAVGSAAQPSNIERIYDSALDSLLTLQKTQPPENYPLPPYDEARYLTELNIFPEWCLQKLLGMTLAEDEQNLLDDLFQKLTASALAQPQVTVHRDYHSRNIMILPDGLGLIDFQDAVLGPITYDLASLLRDCYIDWPQSVVYQWVRSFAERSEHLRPLDRDQIYQWFDWMGTQRHIKVLGLFVRLWLRDGKAGYLRDLPRVYAYIAWVCGRHPELQEASRWLTSEVLPRLQQQAWWHDYQLEN